MTQTAQGLRVSGDPVVFIMPAQLALKLCVLPGNRGVPVASTPQVEPLQGSGEPVRSRLALHHPVAPARLLPVVSKAEEVETPRFLVLLPWLRFAAGRVEAHQASLVRVEAKAVPAESFRQDLQHPPGIALQLEHQDEV